MKLGTSYYPELVAETEWRRDLLNMREARLSVIRMNEFAWSSLEPREGEYDFGWLDRFLDLAHKLGFEVILCTPTATPPAWFGTQYPEVYVELADGEVRRHGGRRDMDLDNEIYRYFAHQITVKLGERYGQHPAVTHWQLDNELFGVEGPALPPGCHTRAATFRFRQYLKRVHGDLATLNARWGTKFWSQDYSDWSQIETARHPRTTLGHWMDYARWFNESLSGFLKLQADALRGIVNPRQLITHNSTAIFDRGIDHIATGESLDVVGWDAYFGAAGRPYPDAFTAIAHDLFRSAKRKPFLVLETGLAGKGDPSHSAAFFAEMRARGAEMVVLWHWREHRSGPERRSGAFCDHAGRPWADRMAFMQGLAKRAELATPLPVSYAPAKAAILLTVDNVSTVLAPNPYAKGPRKHDYLRMVIECYRAFRRLGVMVDVVRPGDSLDGYTLLIAPATKLIDVKTAADISAFVAKGGTLFATAKAAHETPWGAYLPVHGEPLAEVLGLTVRHDFNLNAVQPVRLAVGDELMNAEEYGDRVELTTATVLASCEGGPWAGSTASSVNTHGQGRAYHVALRSSELIARIAREAVEQAGLPVHAAPGEDAVVVPHLEGKGVWVFNYGAAPVTFAGVEVGAQDFEMIPSAR